MEKSREVLEQERGKQELQLTPKKVLPTPKPVVREPSHSHGEVHGRMAEHYRRGPEGTERSCPQADLRMEVSANMDYYKLKHEPLHEKFARMLALI